MAVISIKNKTKSGSLLVGNTPYATTPVAGYKVWLDASDTATITQSGGAVSQWTDKSANAYTFTQATAANKPSTGVDTQNGKNVLTYGQNDSLLSTAAASTWTFLHTTVSTVFIAFKHTVGASYAYIMSDDGGSSANIGYVILNEPTSNLNVFAERGSSGTYAFVNKTGASTLGTAFTYITAISDPTNATAANRSDVRLKQGSAIKNNVQTSAVNSSSPTTSLRIGDYTTGGNESVQGTMGEILIYESILSAGDILANQQYLANKWGV
jgi:hypothetical protein